MEEYQSYSVLDYSLQIDFQTLYSYELSIEPC